MRFRWPVTGEVLELRLYRHVSYVLENVEDEYDIYQPEWESDQLELVEATASERRALR